MKKLLSPIILLAAAAIWGLAFVAQKASSEISTFTLLFLRSIIAVFALIPITALFDKLSGNGRKIISLKPFKIDIHSVEIIGGFVCGILLFTASAFQQAGITSTDAGKASFITALYVVIVPIYSLFFKKKSALNVWIAVVIATVGFYLLCIGEGFSISGADFLVFICSFIFAMQIIAVDILLPKCDAIRLSLVQFTTVSALSLISALIFETPTPISKIIDFLPEILFLGIASSGIAYTLQILGQKNTAPSLSAIILSLESVFGALFAAMLLGERLTPKEYIGCAAVFFAVIISQLDFKQLKKRIFKKHNHS